MANPSSSRAEAAYARAMAAYQEGSYDLARRLTSDALADDPQHAGARALRARIDARMTPPPGRGSYPGSRPGSPRVPEATSVDPTVLIDRADRPTPDFIEPTIVIQRDELPWRRTEREPAPAPTPPPPSRSPRPVSEPTLLIPPKKKSAASSGTHETSGGFWSRLKGAGGAPPPPRHPQGRGPAPARQPGPGFWTPTTRGIVMAVAGLVIAGLFVVGIVAAARAIWPSGNTLTIRKPEGGTIRGGGLDCGTRGDDCVIKVAADSTVELRAEADDKFVFSGFTGDCAPAGRVSMTQSRSCGATFDPVTGPGGGGVQWPLTITRPTGGTLVAAGGILCGTNGASCTLNLPDGVPVTLQAETDTGFEFVSFTGDCSMNGETTMSGPRTCGATFAKVEGAIAKAPGAQGVDRPGAQPPRPRPEAPPSRPPAASSPAATATQTPVPSGLPVPAPTPQTPTPAPPTQGNVVTVAPVAPVAEPPKPLTPVDTEEQHAKKEIERVIKGYCAAHDTLKADAVQKWYPNVNQGVLKETFKNYKSLKCAVKVPPEYELFNVNEAGAGAARVKFDMKQDIVMKVGGAPKSSETVVTLTLSRSKREAAWLIDRVEAELKPK